jgi:Zn-finger domain-containing protein
MQISKKGREVETKRVDLGELKEDQVKGLADLFSMLAANVEYIKKLTPQFEKLGRSKPGYLQ